MSLGDEESRIVLIAKTNVSAGEELTYELFPCVCVCARTLTCMHLCMNEFAAFKFNLFYASKFSLEINNCVIFLPQV